MTTIAYKDGVIAFDSRVSRNGLIVSDDAHKDFKHNGVTFVMSGCLADKNHLISNYNGESTKELKDSYSSFVIDKGSIYECCYNPENGFWKDDVDRSDVDAIGSGSHHALTAMDLGCSAVEAVKMAIKRDCYSGGRVRTVRVK